MDAGLDGATAPQQGMDVWMWWWTPRPVTARLAAVRAEAEAGRTRLSRGDQISKDSQSVLVCVFVVYSLYTMSAHRSLYDSPGAAMGDVGLDAPSKSVAGALGQLSPVLCAPRMGEQFSRARTDCSPLSGASSGA